MSRTELLLAVLAAFSGIKGNLTPAQCEEAFAIVENEYNDDLEAVEADLRREMNACALACRIQEKG